MQTKHDHSYGVVPLRKGADGNWEVLVIHQFSGLRGDSYWILPKGHPESDESPEEAALRELHEETGLTATLDTDQEFVMEYEFVHEDTRIQKRVVFFVGYVDSGDVKLHPVELRDARWRTFDEARALLTHDNARVLLDAVKTYVHRNS